MIVSCDSAAVVGRRGSESEGCSLQEGKEGQVTGENEWSVRRQEGGQ